MLGLLILHKGGNPYCTQSNQDIQAQTAKKQLSSNFGRSAAHTLLGAVLRQASLPALLAQLEHAERRQLEGRVLRV